MNRRDELAHLDKLAELMRDLKLSLRMGRVDFADPLWQTHLHAYADNALELIAEMREDVPPARSPGKHEPEPLVFAPPKHRPERLKKGGRMRFWLDCEFIEDGHTIDLISIGIVAEDGRELYLQSVEFNIDKASQWVRENVIPHLNSCPHIRTNPPPTLRDMFCRAQAQHKNGQCVDQQRGRIHTCPWRTREQIKREILAFMDIETYGKPELWGYYSAYDHVAFCQLFGTMMDLPEGFPMYTRDIKQWCDMLGNPKLPEQGKGEHNALADARWNKTAWEFLSSGLHVPDYID